MVPILLIADLNPPARVTALDRATAAARTYILPLAVAIAGPSPAKAFLPMLRREVPTPLIERPKLRTADPTLPSAPRTLPTAAPMDPPQLRKAFPTLVTADLRVVPTAWAAERTPLPKERNPDMALVASARPKLRTLAAALPMADTADFPALSADRPILPNPEATEEMAEETAPLILDAIALMALMALVAVLLTRLPSDENGRAIDLPREAIRLAADDTKLRIALAAALTPETMGFAMADASPAQRDQD